MADPVRDAMAAGFQALLRGDTKERDRQVERARKMMNTQASVPKLDIGRDAIIAKMLRIAEHEAGRTLTAAESSAIKAAPEEFARRLLASGYKIPHHLM